MKKILVTGATAQAAVRAAAQESQVIEAARRARQTLDALARSSPSPRRREADDSVRRRLRPAGGPRAPCGERSRRRQAGSGRETTLGEPASGAHLESRLLEERTRVAERRAAASEARAALQSLMHEAELRRRRQDAILPPISASGPSAPSAPPGPSPGSRRAPRAGADEHQTPAGGARHLSRAAPRPPGSKIEAAEAKRKDAADRLADGETNLSETDRAARAALEALAAAREARAGSQARHEAAVQRLAEITRAIAENLDTTPAGLVELAGLKDDRASAGAEEIETKLAFPERATGSGSAP